MMPTPGLFGYSNPQEKHPSPPEDASPLMSSLFSSSYRLKTSEAEEIAGFYGRETMKPTSSTIFRHSLKPTSVRPVVPSDAIATLSSSVALQNGRTVYSSQLICR